MKIFKYSLFFCLAFLITSCFSDDSETSNEMVGEITIDGIEDSYVKTAFIGDKLEISPVVNSATNDLVYEWLLLDKNTGKSDSDGSVIAPKVIGTDKNLSFDIDLAPGSYEIYFKVKNGANEYNVIKSTSLSVLTEFTTGFYIMKETADGNTELDMLSLSGNKMNDLIQKTQGAPMKGKPYSMWTNYGSYYISPDDDQIVSDNAIALLTEDGNVNIMRTTDLDVIFDRKSLFFEDKGSEKARSFLIHLMYGLVLLTDKGAYYTSNPYAQFPSAAGSGKFGMPMSVFCSSKYYTRCMRGYSSFYMWDDESHSLYSVNYNLTPMPLTFSDHTGSDVTQNLAGYECLSCGTNFLGSQQTDEFILRNTANGDRFLYLMNPRMMFAYLNRYVKLDAKSHLAKANAMCMNGLSGRYIYCVDNNQLYGCNFSEEDLPETPMALQGIGSGETITYLSNQYWNQKTDDDFDYLIVGTQSGANYHLYMYKMVGGAPEGAPVRTMSGTGTVKSVRFMSANLSNGYFGRMNQIFPVND